MQEEASVRRASRYQDALRVLFLLGEAGAPTSTSAPTNAVRVINSEMKLQALDFWMRNPDYLADELLTAFEAGKRPDGKELAAAILSTDEPDIRRYPMIRWLFGAYEPLDDALAVLRTAPLVQIVREGDPIAGQVREHHFYLLSAGVNAATQLLLEAPGLSWYRDRAQLVATVAGQDSGSELKARQYKKIEYAKTQRGTPIASVASAVRARLNALTSKSNSKAGAL